MDMTPKSPEPEPETPTRIQPAKPISFSNGFIKRHPITYKECLKNHAAATGGHALDGCCEFMPSPSSTPSDPTSLKCAACGCHRNFHRRDPDDSSLPSSAIEYHRHHPPPPVPPPPLPLSPNSSSPPPISSSYMLISDLNFAANNLSTHHHHHNTPVSRKRFRTKFSEDQKEKMHKFADRIGWKIQKRDEDQVHSFCREVGVDRGVLKVWLHNNHNKNTLNNRHDLSFSGGISTVNGVDGENTNNSNAEDDGVGGGGNGLEQDLGVDGRFESDHGGADGGNANGSSSTS